MQQLVWETAEELDQKLAQRVRNIRKRRSISQEKLASMSGVSYGSIKRFETTGMISLLSLTKIAMALDMADELRDIFTSVPYRDIQEVINEVSEPRVSVPQLMASNRPADRLSGAVR